MTYFQLLFKKTIYNKLTVIIFGIMLSISCFTWFQNFRTQSSLISELRTEASTERHTIKKAKRTLADAHATAQAKRLAQSDLTDTSRDLRRTLQAKSKLQAGQLHQGYQIILSKERTTLSALKHDAKNFKAASVRKIAYLTALDQCQQQYESEAFPTHGVTFVLWLFQYIIPVIYSILIIFLLVQLFSTALYHKQLAKSTLLPQPAALTLLWQLATGLFFTIGMLAVLLLVAYPIASLLAGSGSLSFPIFTYQPGSSQVIYLVAKTVLLKTVLLQALSFAALAVTTLLIVYVVKVPTTALFISLLVVSGLQLLSLSLTWLQQLAQLLPTTYLFSYLVVTGQQRVQLHNPLITPEMGMRVLAIYTLLGLLVLVLLPQLKQRQR